MELHEEPGAFTNDMYGTNAGYSVDHTAETSDDPTDHVDRRNGNPDSGDHVDELADNTISSFDVKLNMDPPEETISDRDKVFEEWATKQLEKSAGNKKRITYKHFKDALGIRQSYFAERYFDLMDKDADGAAPCNEVVKNLQKITRGRPTQKLEFLFKLYDTTGTGAITPEDLKKVFRSCMLESSLRMSDANLDVLVDAMFQSADEGNKGAITFEDLRAQLEKNPEILNNLQISGAQWLKDPNKSRVDRHRYLTLPYYQNNYKKVLTRILCLVLSGLCFFWGAWNFKDANPWLMTARGGGMALNFNCMFVLIFMLRKSITVFRTTWMRNILPLDHHFTLHRLVGWEILIFTLIHTIAHIGNANFVAGKGAFFNETADSILFTDHIKLGLVEGCAFITGWILLVILIVMIIFSLPCIRRTGKFELFYFTHLLYFPFWIVCLLHGPNFWKWFLAPGVIFLFEKISELPIVKFATQKRFFIKDVSLLPSGVTCLTISKPNTMDFRPGDYVFLKVSEISKREWHPFTISSAPEVDGHFTLHIRSFGNWTKNLYEYFDNIIENTRGGADPRPKQKVGIARSLMHSLSIKRRDKQPKRRFTVKNKTVSIKCHIKGPYGTPTREIFDTEHAVLVGAGIGVTPFASILQSIMYRYKMSKRTCPNCSHDFYDNIPAVAMKLRKVDFVWVNRNQKEFEWFLSLLTQLEAEQASMKGFERILDIHMYMTAALKNTDMKGVLLQMALDMIHKKQEIDLVTGLKNRLQPGRPDWNSIFKEISKENRGQVKVFFCGPPVLAKALMKNCQKYGFAFSKETF